jgi:PAS domain S-box-containing protein
LVRELELRAIELEQQNEWLREAQRDLEQSLQRFSDLYDFAPVGYLTLDRNMTITQANLTISTMLGVERSRLIGQSLHLFVQPKSRDVIYTARQSGTRWSGDLLLRKADGGELPVSMEMMSISEPAEAGLWRCALIDATARHIAEQRVRESEQRYRGLAEQLVDGIFVTDSHGRYVDANSAGCEMFGYELEELKRLTVEDVVTPAESSKLPEQFERLATGGIIRNEWRFKRKDGSTFDGELVASQLPDGRLQGVVRDLTEQRRSAQALLRRLEFEQFLFELSRTFIGLPEEEVDVNMERGLARVGEFLEMDRVTLFELSRDRTELAVPYSWSASGVSSAPRVITQNLPWWMSRVLRGDVSLASHLDDLPEEAAAERAYLRQEGVASAASIPLRVGGEIAGAISFVTLRRHVTWTAELVSQLRAIGDILWNALKRRQAMQALLAAQAVVRQSEERFRLAMNNVAAGVFTLDLNGMTTYVNPAAEAMFGWTNAELLGRKMHDVTHYKHPDGTPYPASECPGLQILQDGIERRDHEDTFIRRDGSFFPVVFSASALKKDGTTVGIVVGFRDETLRRDAERALRESAALRASEERYRGLAEQVVDGIIIISSGGRVLDANRAACEMFGYRLDELKDLNLEDGIAVEDLPKLPETLERLARQKILRDEWHLKRKDGSVFAAEVVGRQLPDGRIQAVVRDITDRREAEELERRLHQLATVAVGASLSDVLGSVVETAIAVARADFGDVQLPDARSPVLRIAAHRGFPQWWIDYWQNASAGHGVCGTAMVRRERVIVEDVERTSIFTRADLDMQRKAGVRAVQSTPLTTRSGQFIGMISTHCRKPHRPDERTLQRLDRLAREAADIISYVQAKAELKRQAALLDLARNGIFVRDLDGRILYWNEGAVQCYGWSREEALGKVSHDLLQTEYPEPLERILEAVIHSGRWEGELVQTCRDGRRITVESRWAILYDSDGGGGLRVLEINDDITQRKQAETALRDSEQQLQSYIDQAGDGIYVLDGRSGRILTANARAAEMLGYSRDELMQLSASDIECMHPPEDIDVFHRRSKGDVVEVEGLHRRKDGSTLPVEIRMTALALTPPDRILAIVRDVSERKRLEHERADEARRKDEFLAFLGHELRNPLAAVHTASQVLSSGASPAVRIRMEETIARQTTLMRRLVDDLLEHERIAHGHIELRLNRVDLADCLNRAVAAVQSTVASRRQHLVLRLPAEPVRFMADATRLDQIVANLLTNASKYTGPGGSIELSGAQEGGDVVIRCKDNGQGVAREFQQKIFEPFARGQKTELGYGEASIGLGLALVKQLTELHGGTISVESAGAGLGSEFIARLPFVAPVDLPPAEASEPADAPRSARSVVLVEDNPSVGTTLQAALEQAGHSVRLYTDASSALAGVSEATADVLVIDIGLPGMDGYELAAALKQRENIKHALCIAVSGFKRRQQAGGGDPFDHFFNKPIDVPALLALLDEPPAD